MPSKHRKLCISLLPESYEQLKEWMPQYQEGDIIEVRMDHIPKASLKKIRGLSKKPLIITLRSKNEGGFWNGKPAEYQKLLHSAITAKANYIDLEYQMAAAVMPKLKPGDTKVILSSHTDLTGFEPLKALLEEMTTIKADVYKLIFSAETLHDNIAALQLIRFAKSQKINFVIHAMQESGRVSRLIGALKGNSWTYVAREFNEETASGQLSFHEAKNYFYLPQKSASTRVFGLVGSPIQQSRGWRLHNRLIQEKIARKEAGSSKDLLYVNFPAEHLDEFWADWQEHIHGLSVTIPYKEQVIKHLTHVSTEVRISGVCNTIVREGNGWKGYNTDLLAIETLLRQYLPKLKGGGLIVGTGATARSAISALKRLDVNPVFVVGRNVDRGKMLAQTFGIDYLKENEVHYASASAIIQTTPVGMVPYIDKYPLGTALFRKDRIVLDVIYNPPETRFIKIANERGCITISGEEMFLYQAAKQFEIFTGLSVPQEEIRKVWSEIG